MRINQYLGPAALIVANCGTRCLHVHAQPIGSLANAGDNVNIGHKASEAGESKAYEHIYSWEPAKRQPQKREDSDVGVEPAGDADTHFTRRSTERNDSGHVHRLLFDSRDGDSGVRWAYGDRQGRWKEIRENENAVREHPFYG